MSCLEIAFKMCISLFFLKKSLSQIWQYEQYKDKVSNICNFFLSWNCLKAQNKWLVSLYAWIDYADKSMLPRPQLCASSAQRISQYYTYKLKYTEKFKAFFFFFLLCLSLIMGFLFLLKKKKSFRSFRNFLWSAINWFNTSFHLDFMQF